MEKIPTIFLRDFANKAKITRKINPDCQWVFDGEGIATRKYDGACCAILDDGRFVKRREVKKGNPIPDNFIELDYDPQTGKRVGWTPVNFQSSEDKYFVEAYNNSVCSNINGIKYVVFQNTAIKAIGTFELIGEKVQGNPEKATGHLLIPHSLATVYENCPRAYDDLKQWLENKNIEGIVFHHFDGRMAKIKKKDFGLKDELP